jgi:hypothetical protein
MPGKSLFPAIPFEEAQKIARVIAEKNAGKRMRRLDVFEEMGKAPDSGPSRTLITASSAYGLTTGGYQADFLDLAPLGRRLAIEGDETAAIDAVLHVEVFKRFFDEYKNQALPADVAARSFLAENGIPADRTQACLRLLLESGRQVGLICEVSGSQRVLTREHAIERKGGQPVDEQKASSGATQKPPMLPTQDAKGINLASLSIKLEIILPADATPETYDAIFSSMRKHLFP